MVAAIRSPHREYSDVLVAHGLEAMCNLMDNNKANRDRLVELRACAGFERASDSFQSPSFSICHSSFTFLCCFLIYS